MAGSDNEPANSSSDESVSPSDSDTEKPQLPDPIIKPLADDQSENPRSTGKRPPAAADGGDLKRMKKNPTVVAVAAPDADIYGERKQLFQRLWSEDNEIELIQGMISYVNEKGKDPLADVTDFHHFVKKSLHVDVNFRQVLTKARRLKKKFENNVARVENKGKVRSFSNPHEKKMYELSKNLWGDDNNNKYNNNVVASKKVNVKVNVTPKTTKTHKPPVDSGSGNLGSMELWITDEVIINKGLELVSGVKKVEMEAKWKNLKVQELEHFLKKVDVLKEQTEIVLNAIAKSGDK